MGEDHQPITPVETATQLMRELEAFRGQVLDQGDLNRRRLIVAFWLVLVCGIANAVFTHFEGERVGLALCVFALSLFLVLLTGGYAYAETAIVLRRTNRKIALIRQNMESTSNTQPEATR